MGLYLLHLHLHGLFRGTNLELGRDADTGGQTTYVLELARALGAHPSVDRLEVISRCISDRRVSADYAVRQEILDAKTIIQRFCFGQRRYLRKELLWPHLEELLDQLVLHITRQPRRPDWIHAHYADAGWVGARLQQRLGIPLVFTGHSLGREKLRRLVDMGHSPEQVNQHYAIERRIAAEEEALAAASLVVTSTVQEARNQYGGYRCFHPDLPEVIPPGVDCSAFNPHSSPGEDASITALMQPFLRQPQLPPLLALSRPDRRKNIPALVEAFAASASLRERHNLVLVLGSRKDIHQLEKSQRDEWQLVLEAIDRGDLYGQVAYPKQHHRSQVPAIYRWAAARRGLFVNPSLTEPFGLTLLEAAACGLPLVATDDGGPRDILARCRNGLLVDVTQPGGLQQVLEQATAATAPWDQWRSQGLEAMESSYSWSAHAEHYLRVAQQFFLASPHQHPRGRRHLIGVPRRIRKAFTPAVAAAADKNERS
jgi:sucrose-phosphate synthase